MTYKLSFKEHKKWLCVVTTGRFEVFEDLLDRANAFLAKSAEIGVKKVLLDNRDFITVPDAYDSARLVKKLIENGVHLDGFRVAALASDEEFAKYKSNEVFYLNSSLSYKVFNDMDAALEWLNI